MGLTVYGGGGKPEEEKTVTAGTSVIEVLPSSGKVMKKVTVNPTPTESKSVTPTTSELTVTPSEGKHLSQVVVGAVEDITPEVTAQTPVITQIAENLGVTITTPSGTNKQILQGNNSNLLNIKNNAKKEGLYVWKKLTAEGGGFIDFAVDNDPTAYPDGGTQGGYWYEKVKDGLTPEMFGCTKYAVDTFTFSSRTELINPINHSLNEMPKIALIIAKTTSGMADSDIVSMFGMKKIQKDQVAATGLIYHSSRPENAWDSSRGFNFFYDFKVSFNGYSRYFAAGVEYTLITMA